MISKFSYKISPQIVHYSTNVAGKNVYSKTVLLPKTQLPLRLENKKLIERDENINKVANFEELYVWQKGNLSEPEFVLHDGPPYANGKLHMGHAINKILKDTILRYQILKGNKVHYVPGWDCHGLPIELKAVTNSENLSPIEIRTKAQKFAENTVNDQMESFKSWGVIGDWNNAYKTFTTDYVKNQLRIFYKIYEKGLIYRDIKPIYWSPSSRTALAEAELEYNEHHKSPSVYLQLKVKNIPALDFLNDKNIFAIIWTTTPWTLPCNQGICYNENIKYSFIKKIDNNDENIYIVGSDLVKDFSTLMKCEFQILNTFKGEVFKNSSYVHPIYKDEICKFYESSHVSITKGTGLVHTAPAHGPDDFLVALKNKIPLVDLIDEKGQYRPEVGSQFSGKYVLTDGNKTVLDLLSKDIMRLGEIKHSYPYDWRTKQPVIIRASHQWFLDTNSIKNRAVELVENIDVYPKINADIFKTNFINQIKKRPYWCISRQRKWGVPIPVFYNNKEVIINENTINQYCSLVDKHGTHFWWQLKKDELLPKNSFQELDMDSLEQGQDILDIWFDSGITWSKVLEGRKVADLYLEGMDQITGWFQSSLLTSVALRDKAPYKSLYVHGFAVDENGNKMSKSLGNIIDPLHIVKGNKKEKPYGIDVLRWWVACHANQDSMAPVSTNVLKSSLEDIQKIRSVLRFALGGLSDYNLKPEAYNNLLLIDKYMLHILYCFHQEITEAVKEYEFHKVGINVVNLLTNSVSALYYTTIKDRLYCDIADSATRRSAQFVLYQIFEIVSQAIAPIVPHLAEEMFLNLPQKDNNTYFRSEHVVPQENWKNDKVDNLLQFILKIKKDINKQVQNTQNSDIYLKVSNKLMKTLKDGQNIEDLEYQLTDIFQVASVKIIIDNIPTEYVLEIKTTLQQSCPRCRKMQLSNQQDLCKRCNFVVNFLDIKDKIEV